MELSKQFPTEVLSSFKEANPQFGTTEGAKFACQMASEAFQIHAREHGVPDVGRMAVDDTHTVNTSRGQVIDWTARQHDPSAEFPHVEPVQSFRAKYKKAVRD